MNAIPTLWNGIRFRSRLEARWAAFFTALEWPWSYEPIDLAGYIPDFLLHFHVDLLVEVKPFTSLQDPIIEEAANKAVASGWNHEVLVVGSRLFQDSSELRIGALLDKPMHDLQPAPFGRYYKGSHAPHWALTHETQCYHCRVCGEHPGGTHPQEDQAEAMRRWNGAGSQVQWKPGS